MATVTINLDLYEFLKDRETHLFVENEEVKAITFIDFSDLDEFISVVGRTYFTDDGGIDVKLQDGNICIELNDIFQYEGNTILDYKKCFTEEYLERYKEELKRQFGV